MRNFQSVFIFLILITFKNTSAQVPAFTWTKSAGGINNDFSNAVTTDQNGNIFIVGTFQESSIIFGNSTLYNSSAGSLDIFLVKYDPFGNVLWARSAGGTSDDYCYAICTDREGNVFISGYFRSDNISFDTITINNADTANIGVDIFITKYDTSGILLWAKSVTKRGWELPYAICSDKDDNVYVTGMFDDSYDSAMVFGSDTLSAVDSYDFFITKYNPNGSVLWAKSAGGSRSEAGFGVCVDENNNVYVTGYFQNETVFENDTVFGPQNFNAFLVKYSPGGNLIWVESILGPQFPMGAGTGLTVSNNNLYMVGYFSHSISLGNDTLSNYGLYSIFLAKFDTSGLAIWGRCPGGTGYDYGNSISSDTSGHILITGNFESSYLNFGGHAVLNSNVGYDDAFVAEYDESGNALWATSIGGEDYDYGMGIAASKDGNIYMTGYIGSYEVSFGNTTITNNGSYDVFLTKLSLNTGIEEFEESAWNVYPNPSNGRFQITHSELIKSDYTVNLFNVTGEKIYSREIKTSNQPTLIDLLLKPGLYLIQLTDGNESATRKIIIE